jgi:MDMPI C-terminal domain
VHRWDAETAHTPTLTPIDLARDGIAEFFDVFVATGLAAGTVQPTAATLVLEPTDLDERIEQHLPDPGPETVLHGTTSNLLLALWHRRDPVSLHVGGDRAQLKRWPHI